MDEHKPGPGYSRRESLRIGLVGAGGVLLPGLLIACGDDSPSKRATTAGTQVDTSSLKPFDPNAPAGAKPSLPRRVGDPGIIDDAQYLAFDRNMGLAAKTNGLEDVRGVGNGDLAKTTDQIQTMFAQGLGAIYIPNSVAADATRPFAEQALAKGMLVMTVLLPYSHIQWANDQAADGVIMGRAAAKWIRENLDGRAKVLNFHTDKAYPESRAMHRSILAELKKVGPDVEIKDVEGKSTAEQNANVTATLLQSDPDINVVIGNGSSAIGAFSTFSAKGKGKATDVYIAVYSAGDDALAEVSSGNSAIKAAFLYSGPLVGYGYGLYANDWLEGMSVPRLVAPPSGAAIEISTPEGVAEYQRDMKDAAGTWNDPKRRGKYVNLWGNVSYETRDDYWREIAKAPDAARS